jgi:tRNA nucleotidyltransferase/poly(A) polymerase
MDFKDIEEEILEDSVLSKLSALACQERIPLFLVGGYLRDLLLGIRRKITISSWQRKQPLTFPG